MKFRRVPVATYRLQFNADFGFEKARDVLDYLKRLGVSDVYASPLFHAGPGSTHGYDVCSYERISPELGSEGDFQKFTEELREHELGLLLDMVPNHMASDLSNPWWRDVLKHGRKSQYAAVFDIDWNSPHSPGKVMLPVLGDRYATVLNKGELKLGCEGGEFYVGYYDKHFPVSPESAAGLNDQLMEHINASPQKLDEFIQKQNYRLAYWRLASDEINYRRFFDITGLVSVRVEDPAVFRQTHCYLKKLLNEGIVTGVRVDHPDGLWNPQKYFSDLQELTNEDAGKLYVVAEKILSEGE